MEESEPVTTGRASRDPRSRSQSGMVPPPYAQAVQEGARGSRGTNIQFLQGSHNTTTTHECQSGVWMVRSSEVRSTETGPARGRTVEMRWENVRGRSVPAQSTDGSKGSGSVGPSGLVLYPGTNRATAVLYRRWLSRLRPERVQWDEVVWGEGGHCQGPKSRRRAYTRTQSKLLSWISRSVC